MNRPSVLALQVPSYFSVAFSFLAVNLDSDISLLSFIAKLFLGDALKEGTPISVNPLVVWAWAGLLINAINSIPAGELDGGRISFAIWGRKVNCLLKTSDICVFL